MPQHRFNVLALQETEERDHMENQKYSPLEGDVTLLNTLHVEAHGGDGAMAMYQRMGQAH